jgi:aromatic ring hydroxylase
MVEEYVKWYDRHFDPDWQDILLSEPDAKGQRLPLAFEVPKTSAHLQRLGKALRAVLFASGGNITHTPGYGALIALGLLNHLTGLNNSPEEIEAAEKYRESIARSGRFLTYAGGGALIGSRLKKDPRERVALRLESETDKGVVVSGKVQMHTSTPFAEDVLITSRDELPPGVRVVARRTAARHANPFLSPLSTRFDELDALLWLKDVFIPREHVFTAELMDRTKRHSLTSWLIWHHNCGWLAKAELTLGLSLAVAEVMGLKENPATIEQLVDLAVDVQTSRTCITAAELEPEMTARGYAIPGQLHLAAAAINIFKSRQRMSEILRGLPGSSLVNAPADTDFADPIMAEELEDAFGGGGYSALQRAALLQLAWDQVASGLDGRESTFELHASGGLVAWRARLRAWFQSYNELANGVQQFLGVQLPTMDLSTLHNMPNERPRVVTPPST